MLGVPGRIQIHAMTVATIENAEASRKADSPPANFQTWPESRAPITPPMPDENP